MTNTVVEAVKDLHPVDKAESVVRKAGKIKKFIPKSVTRVVGKSSLTLHRQSPEILFAGGLVLGVATVVTACRSTLKLEDTLEQNLTQQAAARELARLNEGAADEYSESDASKDIAKLRVRAAVKVVHLYLPSIALGVASVACLTKAHNIQNNRIAGLTAAYTALDKGFQQYRERVIAELGEDKDREFRYGKQEITETVEDKNGPKKHKRTVAGPNGASIYARFFDEYTRNWAPNNMTNRTFIQCQQNWANDLLHSRGHVFLNEVYDMLGMERSPEGQIVGWTTDGDGDGFIDFGIFDKQNQERVHDFMFGNEKSILLDFNVDGPIVKKIGGHA